MQRPDLSALAAPLSAIYGRFWREERLLLAAVALVVFGGAIAAVAMPYLFSRFIDGLGTGALEAVLVGMLLGYAVLRGLTVLFGQAASFLSIMAAENLNFIAATQFFEKLVRKPVVFFIEHNPVEIQSARTEGQQALYILVQLALIVFIPGVTQIVLSLGMLGAVINFEIVLIVLVYGAGFIALTYFANRWTRPLLDMAIEANQENAKFVGNAVNAMETLRYFNGDRWISTSFQDKAEEARSSWNAWARRRITLSGIYGVAIGAQLAIALLIQLPRYQAGELSVGDIVLLNMLLIQLNQPFEMIGSAIDDLMRSASRFRPFARMWQSPEDRLVDVAGQLALSEGALAFEDVSFGYGDTPMVRDITFTVRRGEVTFLVGETGSGKSTLLKLALKAIEPASGRITVDGVDLASIGRAGWYGVIGVVPQDVMLLNDTLGTNIVLGRPFDAARLRRAAERARILDFITAQPEGFATTVGERGLKLSGGERQRVAIARALYMDPAIIFLDEASSALDEGTEAAIIDELRNETGRVTILAITHRKSVIGPHDQVIVLENGQVRPARNEERRHEVTPPGKDRL
jgi:ABC-type bacteriocin/lantibiotic exporter with double-glycine peptidase domain